MLKQAPIASKYWILAEQLRRQMLDGSLRPGDRVPSLAEMMAQHKVSRATIEKVHDVLEQEGLIVREQGRGTFVAEPKARAATGVIGVVGAGFGERHHSLYWADLLKGIRRGVREAGMHTLIVDQEVDQPWLFNCWDKMDGVLLCGNGLEVLLQWMPPHIKAVSLLVPIAGTTSVVADEYSGMKQAVQELVKLGHQRIAYLIVRHHPLAQPRINGYTDGLREAGIEPQANWIRPLNPEFNPKETRLTALSRERMHEWLEQDWSDLGCTALLTQNDEAAIGAIQAFQEAGINVPDQVSVVGFDGTELSEHFSPALSTVEMPLERIGSLGVEKLLYELRHKDSSGAPQTIILPTAVRKAASVAAISADL